MASEEKLMSSQYDAIIIGTGIIGGAIGLELARRGSRTLNVDKLPAAGYGSTSNTCAIIRFHYSTAEGIAMARESYYYWLDWPKYIGTPDESGLAHYINTGCLVIKNEENQFLEHVLPHLDALKVAYETLGPQELRALLPYVDTRQFGPPVLVEDPRFGQPTGDAIAGAIYIPESGFINDPQLACHNQQRGCEARGGQFLFNAEVVEILTEDGRVAGIKLADGTEMLAPVVVNAAGPHSFKINRMAGVEEGMRIRTRALKREVCHVPAPKGLDLNVLGTMISDGDTGSYARPEVGNNLLVGSQDPECDAQEWVDPDDYDQSFTYQWKTQVMRKAQRIPSLPIPEQQRGVVDLYDVSDDWLPIYDVSDLPGFYMAVGTSGNQFKNAPVVGKLMAELIGKVEANQDHDNDPVQLPLVYTRRTCNIGFFSRLREVNPDSSNTVMG
jgi:sarcosine oxidase subunit beta